MPGAVGKTSTPTSAWPTCSPSPMQPAGRALLAAVAAVLNRWGRGGLCRLKPAFQAVRAILAVGCHAEGGAVFP